MPTSVLIIVLGLFIFWGHYLNGVFERKGIPDVLGLMLIGILIGPVLDLVDPQSFGKFGSLFSNLVLIFILFESGIDLRFNDIKSSLKDSSGITAAGFFVTWISTAAVCILVFQLPVLTSLFIGSTLGGTSSAVVVGLVKKIAVTPRTATTLIMESAETDVFTLAIPLSILGLMMTGQLNAGMVVTQFLSSLALSLFFGIAGAFAWASIVNKITTLKATKFSTPAFLFILYGITEYLDASGPLAALTFGIAIGNLEFFEPKLLQKIIPNQSIVLPPGEKDFFSQLVFLLRTFFFVFIGVSIQISRLDWLLWGALITLLLYLLRLVTVKAVIPNTLPVIDRATMSLMIPKGLGAAVIATLPLQQGHPDGTIIQSICFSVILFSTLYCAALYFLLQKGITIPFYQLCFKLPKSSAPGSNSNT